MAQPGGRTALLDHPRTDHPRTGPFAPDGAQRRPAGRVGSSVSHLVDVVVLCGLALFAVWTVSCLAAVAGLISSPVAFWAWVASAPLVVWGTVRWLRGLLEPLPDTSPWVGLGLSAAAAAAALLIVRPDLDDAFYVARSTWIAANGDVGVGDVLFSDGVWPGLQPGMPYLQTIEALFGWLARASGLSVGTLVYVVYVPVAAATAVWVLGLLLRAWGVRRPAAALALACTFLLFSGATHGSWGNLHLARIWQGKITFLAVLVPLTYALAATFWTARRRAARAAALAALALAGIAGIGLTPTAVFVTPAIALAAAVPGLVQRRWAEAGSLFAAGAGPALVVGAGVVLLGGSSGSNPPTGEDPWVKVLGTGVLAVVVLLAATVAVLASVRPARWSGSGPVGRQTAAAAVVLGALVAVPVLYDVAVAVLGTDEIAWRLTWIVPVPALVGLLAALPRWSPRLSPGIPAAVLTAAVVVLAGLPLWSPANGAWIAAPTAWKHKPPVLEAARWVVDRSTEGLVLAPVETAAAIAVVSPDVRPVGSRPFYMDVYVDRPDARMTERTLLQRLADVPPGAPADPADLAGGPAALEALDVQVVCATGAASPLAEMALATGYSPAFTNPVVACFERAPA